MIEPAGLGKVHDAHGGERQRMADQIDGGLDGSLEADASELVGDVPGHGRQVRATRP